MTSTTTRTEAEARAIAGEARLAGRRAYWMRLNATRYEVREWASA